MTDYLTPEQRGPLMAPTYWNFIAVRRSHKVLDEVARELADALRWSIKSLHPNLTGATPEGPCPEVESGLAALARVDALTSGERADTTNKEDT